MVHLKKKVEIFLVLFAFVLCGICGCRPNSRPTTTNTATATDTSKMADTSTMKMADTIKKSAAKSDTSKKHLVNHERYVTNGKSPDLKYGILGYSYPPSIIVGESKSIHAFVSIIFPQSKVKDTLLKITLADDPTAKGDSMSITEPIRLYKYVTLKLMALDTSLKVTSFNDDSGRQQIDTLNGNKWSWNILATSADRPVSTLKLLISTEGPDHNEEKTIPISIKVNPYLGREIYDFLTNNPKVLVVSIIIPLVAFVGGLVVRKKKKKAKSV